MKKSMIEQHLKYKDKSMSELIAERTEKLSVGQSKLRSKWLPEEYSSHSLKKKPL
ncbi:hypothetical protein [Cytobacillus horneckiae]|uniref:hypothetical protein n=1 Tax=Cytobacillus horneckiae TaxID=549687 RepID=UPI003D9AA849